LLSQPSTGRHARARASARSSDIFGRFGWRCLRSVITCIVDSPSFPFSPPSLCTVGSIELKLFITGAMIACFTGVMFAFGLVPSGSATTAAGGGAVGMPAGRFTIVRLALPRSPPSVRPGIIFEASGAGAASAVAPGACSGAATAAATAAAVGGGASNAAGGGAGRLRALRDGRPDETCTSAPSAMFDVASAVDGAGAAAASARAGDGLGAGAGSSGGLIRSGAAAALFFAAFARRLRSASAFFLATRASCSSVKLVVCGTRPCISAHDAHIRCIRFLSPRAMPAPMQASISVFDGCHTWIPASNPPHASPMHGAACSVLRTFSGTHLRATGNDASCLYVKTPVCLLAQLLGEPHIGAILRSGEAITGGLALRQRCETVRRRLRVTGAGAHAPRPLTS